MILVLYKPVNKKLEKSFQNADIMPMKAKKEGEELVKVGYRLPPDIIKRIEKSAVEHRRSVNDEVITIFEEFFSVSKIMKDANMRNILASLANMPGNFGEYNLTKADLKKFFNTYVDVMADFVAAPPKPKPPA
jgi:arginyl-tRNA synthetase